MVFYMSDCYLLASTFTVFVFLVLLFQIFLLFLFYRYGGIYLDSDIIVLKPLLALNNSVGLEDQLAGSSLNGALMAFRKQR